MNTSGHLHFRLDFLMEAINMILILVHIVCSIDYLITSADVRADGKRCGWLSKGLTSHNESFDRT